MCGIEIKSISALQCNIIAQRHCEPGIRLIIILIHKMYSPIILFTTLFTSSIMASLTMALCSMEFIKSILYYNRYHHILSLIPSLTQLIQSLKMMRYNVTLSHIGVIACPRQCLLYCVWDMSQALRHMETRPIHVQLY